VKNRDKLERGGGNSKIGANGIEEGGGIFENCCPDFRII